MNHIKIYHFYQLKKEKLLTTLENKEKYVVHIATLKQALLRIRILKSTQSYFI